MMISYLTTSLKGTLHRTTCIDA